MFNIHLILFYLHNRNTPSIAERILLKFRNFRPHFPHRSKMAIHVNIIDISS